MTRGHRVTELLRNRFDRVVLADGVVAWVYEYKNRDVVPIPTHVSTGFELGVQLEGDWLHHGSLTGKRLFQPGMVHTISPAERFSYSFQAQSCG